MPQHHVRSCVRPAALSAFAAALAWGATAAPHGLDANRLQVVVHESTAEVVATPPSEFVAVADANGDGLLDRAEVSARRDDVLRALVSALVVTDGDGRPGALERADVSVPRSGDDDTRGSDFLRLTVVLRWPGPPAAVRVRCGFVRQHPVVLYATHADGLSQPGVLTLVGDGEYRTLATPDAEVTVLRRSLAAPAPSPASPPRRSPRVRRVPSALTVLLASLAAVLLLLVRKTRYVRPLGDPP
jgi:hypothetical protein